MTQLQTIRAAARERATDRAVLERDVLSTMPPLTRKIYHQIVEGDRYEPFHDTKVKAVKDLIAAGLLRPGVRSPELRTYAVPVDAVSPISEQWPGYTSYRNSPDHPLLAEAFDAAFNAGADFRGDREAAKESAWATFREVLNGER